jgi:uncharacterized protein with WD repeat
MCKGALAAIDAFILELQELYDVGRITYYMPFSFRNKLIVNQVELQIIICEYQRQESSVLLLNRFGNNTVIDVLMGEFSKRILLENAEIN